uniref:Uncharacterized protein n=1 Tax=Acrobeloides nanus TaxID=290746 RepID=A0A914DFY4_9BILA
IPTTFKKRRLSVKVVRPSNKATISTDSTQPKFGYVYPARRLAFLEQAGIEITSEHYPLKEYSLLTRKIFFTNKWNDGDRKIEMPCADYPIPAKIVSFVYQCGSFG